MWTVSWQSEPLKLQAPKGKYNYDRKSNPLITAQWDFQIYVYTCNSDTDRDNEWRLIWSCQKEYMFYLAKICVLFPDKSMAVSQVYPVQSLSACCSPSKSTKRHSWASKTNQSFNLQGRISPLLSGPILFYYYYHHVYSQDKMHCPR